MLRTGHTNQPKHTKVTRRTSTEVPEQRHEGKESRSRDRETLSKWLDRFYFPLRNSKRMMGNTKSLKNCPFRFTAYYYYFFLPYSSFFSCLLSFFFSEHCGQFVCSGFAYYKNVVKKKLQKMLIYRYLRVRTQFIRMGGVEGKIGRNSGWHDSTQLDN